MRFIPPDYLLVFVILEIILHYVVPIRQVIGYPFAYLGVFVIILGIAPSFWVYFHFRSIKTTIKPYKTPSRLSTSGLFKISRNPIYLGMVFILLGGAIFLGSLSGFIIPIIFVILMNRFIIKGEENNLEKKFSEKYLDYKRKVRRWI